MVDLLLKVVALLFLKLNTSKMSLILVTLLVKKGIPGMKNSKQMSSFKNSKGP